MGMISVFEEIEVPIGPGSTSGNSTYLVESLIYVHINTDRSTPFNEEITIVNIQIGNVSSVREDFVV